MERGKTNAIGQRRVSVYKHGQGGTTSLVPSGAAASDVDDQWERRLGNRTLAQEPATQTIALIHGNRGVWRFKSLYKEKIFKRRGSVDSQTAGRLGRMQSRARFETTLTNGDPGGPGQTTPDN